MATYFDLQNYRNQPVESVFAATDIAEDNRVVECSAAIKLQSVGRMRKAFRRYMYVRRCIVDMQRVYRGYRGRVKYLLADIDAAEARQRNIVAYYATIIQSRFRGFYSRKWFSDYYAQKKYLCQVQAKSEAVKQEAVNMRDSQLNEKNEGLQTATYDEYLKATANMHHLLSTAARSGVLRPGMSQKGLTTVFSTNIEDDIRKVPIPRRKFKADLPMSTCSPAPTKGGSRVPPVAMVGPSLHCQSPYDAVEDAARLEKRVNRKLLENIHTTDFVTRKPAQPTAPKSLGAEGQYLDQAKIRSRR